MFDVSIVKCESYSENDVTIAMDKLINLIGGLDWVKKDMKIAIKVNLVSSMKPEKAATTHPALVCELTKKLIEKGAIVTVGDSPGGIYNSIYLNNVYSGTNMTKVKDVGGILNSNFNQSTAHFPDGKVLKDFTYTSYLDDADVIINFCKFKSHGMMGLSVATKNIFGTIPGTLKPEFHFRFPDHLDFANMLIDLNEYFKPKIHFVDAVVGMEGNGPTAGNPKQIGLLLASENPYKLDYVCATLMGLKKDDVPILAEAYKRNLIPENVADITCNENFFDLIIKDFDAIHNRRSLLFEDKNKLFGKIASKALTSTPYLKEKECIGCGKCAEVCPANAIEIVNKKAVINKKKCIRCFCCQEFCPKGAMKVKRPIIAKILNK